MYIEKIIHLFDTTIANKVLSVYEEYHIFYCFILVAILNAILLIYKNRKYSWSYKEYIIAFVIIFVSTVFFLYLATLWFQKWFYIDSAPFILGVKTASISTVLYYLFLVSLIHKQGASSYFNSISLDYTILTLYNILIFIIILSTVTSIGYIVEFISLSIIH